MLYKSLFLVLLVFFVTLFSASVSAQISVSTDSASRLKTQKAELKLQMKKAIQSKREEFKMKLQTIKDEKKRVLVERIDAKLVTINTKHTERFAKVLEKLQSILDRITGQDTSTAQAAINLAKASIESQADKTYTVTITNEARLRANTGLTTSQLRQDLMATHKLVVDAKQAVQALRKDTNGSK